MVRGTIDLESAPMAPSPAALPPVALAELAESDAPPEIQRIYREISDLAGIPLPALIWRHIATYPGVLPVTWAAVRPLFARGMVQEAAWRATATALAGQSSSVTRARLRQAHLPPAAEIAYERVLASYNRANPVNCVAMRLLLAASAPGAGEVVALPSAHDHWSPPPPVEGVPPMMPVSEIRVFERGQIDRLAADGRIDRSRIVPSLYRHLTTWPALIRLIHDDLEPRMRSGEILALITRLSSALDAQAERLAPHVAPLPGLAAVPGLRETMTQFSGGLIPEMIVVGHMLREGLERGH